MNKDLLNQYRAWQEVPWWWKYGGRRDFWYEHLDLVQNFIKENSLKAMTEERTPAGAGSHASAPQAEMRSALPMQLWPGPLNGGIRVPHLHHEGQFYLLNNAQWAKFSKKVVEHVSDKLAKVQKVSFDQLMDMADATHSL